MSDNVLYQRLLKRVAPVRGCLPVIMRNSAGVECFQFYAKGAYRLEVAFDRWTPRFAHIYLCPTDTSNTRPDDDHAVACFRLRSSEDLDMLVNVINLYASTYL